MSTETTILPENIKKRLSQKASEIESRIYNINDGAYYGGREEYIRSLRLIEALERIANPIGYLRKEAEKEGYQFNRMMANQIASDPHWFQNEAQKAINEYNSLP